MIPDKLGSKDGVPWRSWSELTRAYVEMLSPTLALQLKQVEGREQPLQEDEITTAGVPEQHAAQLGRYLKLRTEGNAHTIIKSSQARSEHPLEQWRLLSWQHDPKGLGSELIEISELLSPNRLRAKSMAELGSAIETWEDQERRHKERHGVDLHEKIRISTYPFPIGPN